jgi:beta-glucosidase-like glycosyl hydrolase/CubicO group peptidase (beta-lactamase class C family)
MKKFFCLIAGMQVCMVVLAQKQAWVDSVFSSLSSKERIAQLMVIRTSSTDAAGKPVIYDSLVERLVKEFNVGAICLFQGNPFQQAQLLNKVQALSKTPVMATVDGEWGLGMRFAGVRNFPYQLTMGALPDAALVYAVGAAIARQCRRMNIHVNYAPVVDINNNPANPVIGVRSFGEDKDKVALYGTRIMQGMQEQGIMACAKHFPGHGDVEVDSHYDLPVISKKLEDLEQLELAPFRALFSEGVGSVMVAHLSIPAIDSTPNRPASISYKSITGLMRSKMGYQGLTFTDALEMKGVAKFYPMGEAAVESLIAGNDMLCLPADVPSAIQAIEKAIEEGRLTRDEIDAKCRRVLEAKYHYVYGKTSAIDTSHLMLDLNREVDSLRSEVARHSLTVLRGNPIHASPRGKRAYVLVGSSPGNAISNALMAKGVKIYHLPLSDTSAHSADRLLTQVKREGFAELVVGIHQLRRSPAGNFGFGAHAIEAVRGMANLATKTSLLVFGNPYAHALFEGAAFGEVVACYEDDAIFQRAAAEWLAGKWPARGKLPVTVGGWKHGTGTTARRGLQRVHPAEVGMRAEVLQRIDSIAAEAIVQRATPGCVVAVVKNGRLVFHKAYGRMTYQDTAEVSLETIYDLASVTKVSATTLAVMKLVEQGKLDVKKPLSTYLPWLIGSDKENLTLENLLLHQAGLVAWIPFFREVTNSATGAPDPTLFSHIKSPGFSIVVNREMYMRNDWVDTMHRRIRQSPVEAGLLRYVYSDNNFILLGRVVESVTGQSLGRFVQSQFYEPLGMQHTGYRVYERFPVAQIAPTEREKIFRKGLIWGYVHDPGAAMLGNEAGHAGLFGTASDLAVLYQMLLNGGVYDGRRYLKKETIDRFTSYQTPISRRGLGFDKPEKDNNRRAASAAYPARWVSRATFGHTGFTGTCVWADPDRNLIYIFLSNRVHPDGGDNRKLLELNIRSRIHDIVYESMEQG